MGDILLDSLLDTLKDSAIAIPFLFGVYLLMEALERHSEVMTGKLFGNKRFYGPLLGSVLGLFPQCGFSAAMSNLYVGGVVEMGTLIAVFLATSDEAVLVMLSNPGSAGKIWQLLLVKFIMGAVFGYLINFIIKLVPGRKTKKIGDICQDENCGCEESSGIVKPAVIHTLKVLAWIAGISFVLNVVIGVIGTDQLARILGGNFFFQPLITALAGLIPNCAISVLFTELYLAGSLSFASTVSGLATSAGLGLIVLFRMNKNKKECFAVAGVLYLCAAVSGLVLNFINIG